MKNEKFVEKEIEIKGMHCSSCVKNIQNAVMDLNGVKNVKVSLADEKAWVKFNPKKTNLAEIKKAINKLGYKTDSNSKVSGDKGSIKQGIIYGLIPHIGCIAFVLASILGATFFTQAFKPLLMNKYFFYILVGVSFAFATISSYFYLKKNGLLSIKGIKRSWNYLTIMYSTTIGINLLFFLFIFPILTNVSAQTPVSYTSGSTLKISVDIPCSGHAPLIVDEVKKIDGVNNVKFEFPNVFYISYDTSKITKENILSLDVFKEYPAKVLDENSNIPNQNSIYNSVGGCGLNGGCGCGLR